MRFALLHLAIALSLLTGPASARSLGAGPVGIDVDVNHNDGCNISFFDGHSKWVKRQWLETNPQIFHKDSTVLP